MPSVIPSRQEARRLVAGVVVYWLSASLLAFTVESVEPWSAAVFVVAFVSIVVFYWTLFSVGGRESGRSASYWFLPHWPRLRGPDNIVAVGREGWGILLKVVNPRWWARVFRVTGWPTTATTGALVGSFVLVTVASISSLSF